ncbi:hypothetical protein FMUND_859 [Fusarium mundagurra]|uniref:Ankyrin n=1 Tax=Fusarium mundagurra TaxID=1567541 RepID=A0A8H5Z5B1_9HYPO|nr:hypothetical protein FMUND_859 [Fusarium mundagurra]
MNRQPSATELYVIFSTLLQHHQQHIHRDFHQMAELLGIIAGGAGLASLALQLVDGGQRLRQRYKNTKGFGGNITWLSEDIELIGKQLMQLEASADDIMQEQLGPIMMGRCRDRCSCHKKCTINGMFWCLQYSPLAEIFKACDNPVCSVRRYRFDLRLTLYRYGIPLKAALGFDLITEPGRYSLEPCLQIETVVDFDTPGFVILGKLASDEIGWATAETMFRDLYKSCPGFVNQVGPSGHGYLEEGLSLHKLGVLLIHPHFVNSITTLVRDLKNAVPTWEAQPVTSFVRPDPFDFGFTKLTLETNPDFGDSPPLHASILFESDINFKLSLERVTQPFEKIVNFMGQSALHMGVCQPSRVTQLLAAGHPVDLGDKNGITPLMYAASMNVPETMMMLVENGANLFATGENDFTVLDLVAFQGNWDLIWQIVDFASVSYPGLVPGLFESLLAYLSSDVLERCYAAHDPSGLKGCIKFWSRVISKLGSPNFYFNDGTTLIRMTNDSRSARALIDLGFTEFKQKDGALLEHLVSLRDLSLFRFAVGNGGDEHLHNDWGWDILNTALGGLTTKSRQDLPDVLETLQFLLDRRVQVVCRDECVCNCSAGGCIPGLSSIPIKSSLRLFAWLEILEKKRDVEEAKKFSLALLRKMCFDQADTDNDRFWDIPEQISIGELNQEMEVLAAKAYSELKIEVMAIYSDGITDLKTTPDSRTAIKLLGTHSPK